MDTNEERACPLVSIVIPVWNVEQFLPYCLDSMLAQTMPDWECILVDDGSTDTSGKICDEYAARDSRFRVIHQENKWSAAARNAGMRIATGRYLTFCDSDDQFHPRLLEWATAAMQTVPSGFVCWRYTRDFAAFNTGKETGAWKRYLSDDSFFIDRTMNWNQPSKLYDRARMVKADVWFNEHWDQHHGEDKDFQDRLMKAWWAEGEVPFCLIDDTLYYWNPGNANSNSRKPLPPRQEETETAVPSNYWPHVYAQMATHQALYPDADHAWPHDLRFMRCFYLRVLAYALCCAKANGEKTPPLGRCKELTALLNSCKAEKTWSVYYLPFRLRQKWLVRFIYRLDESGNRNFGRLDWGFYYLLGGNWNR